MPALYVMTPIGSLLLVSNGRALTHVLPEADPRAAAFCSESPDDLTKRAADAIAAYFAGTCRAFDLPIHPDGTPFQRRVWQALTAVPYGKTVTYAELAAAVGLLHGARAVGGAVAANPLLLLVPCHRVVRADGPGRFLLGTAAKRTLLDLEARR